MILIKYISIIKKNSIKRANHLYLFYTVYYISNTFTTLEKTYKYRINRVYIHICRCPNVRFLL